MTGPPAVRSAAQAPVAPPAAPDVPAGDVLAQGSPTPAFGEPVAPPPRRLPLLERLSLRSRLVVGMLGLVLLVVAGVEAATYTELRSYLNRQVDGQVQSLGGGLATPVRGGRLILNPGTLFLYTDAGQVVQTPVGSPVVPAATLADLLARTGQNDLYGPVTVSAQGGGSYRVVVVRIVADQLVVVGLPLKGVHDTTHRLLAVELLALLVAALAATGLGLTVVRLGLRPLEAIARTADRVSADGGDLSTRVPAAPPNTEVGRLSAALNAMLDRIEDSFAARQASEARLRRFVADASHELRTPLTSIRGYAELFRRGAGTRPEDLGRSMRRIEDEAVRLGGLVEDLLLLARLDQGRPLERRPVDLTVLVADAAADARAAAPDRPVTVTLPPEPVEVPGDQARLRQVLANLVGNAVVHTPAGTPVHLRLGRDGAVARVTVADEGPGIPAAERERVFERFARTDASRQRASGGTGLGLSIVRAIVDAHGGTVRLLSPVPGPRGTGPGAAFEVDLPVHPLGLDAPPPGQPA